MQDARWALAQLRDHHPDVPVFLLGHSMGERVALRVADDPAVVAVCVLAPWTREGEPVRQLAGRSVLIAHGDRERMTDPRLSYRFAVRAKEATDRVCRFEVLGMATRCCAGRGTGRVWCRGSSRASSMPARPGPDDRGRNTPTSAPRPASATPEVGHLAGLRSLTLSTQPDRVHRPPGGGRGW